jgi:hypothetical protein
MKNTQKIEALVDAVGALKGWGNPDSAAYQLRNPLMLKSYALAGKHDVDDNGYRVFKSSLAGLKSSCFDMELKITGASRAGLTQTSTLTNLCGVYELSSSLAVTQVIRFLRRALKDESISKDTPLSYFASDSQKMEK